MNDPLKDFNELTSKAGGYLEFELFYSARMIVEFRRSWKKVKKYMIATNSKYYSGDVEKGFLYSRFKNKKYKEFSPNERNFYNRIKTLTEFQQTGKIKIHTPPRKQPLIFAGLIGEILKDFLDYKMVEDRLSTNRLKYYQHYLFSFLQYCNENAINCIEQINLTVIIDYIKKLDNSKSNPVVYGIAALRNFLKYAFNRQIIAVDYSEKMPKYKSLNQPKLPSTYSKEELEKLIYSVERSSCLGKRNYAIILLASRLGLRASDIAKLTFDHLHWTANLIILKQIKTGKELQLPLLPDVGNSIIDYLKFARPKLEYPYVFLSERPPRGPITSGVVTHVVQKAFKKSGIKIKDKRFGPHSLRHSLGFRMLQESTILPVITEVLGHENTESTKYYLRIDLESMRQCVLDVPTVSRGFYEQKGGAFYA